MNTTTKLKLELETRELRKKDNVNRKSMLKRKNMPSNMMNESEKKPGRDYLTADIYLSFFHSVL